MMGFYKNRAGKRIEMPHWPVALSNCADCGVGTHSTGEWYMVRNEIWAQAWAGRRKPHHDLPGQEILCIGCLEKRIGRTLVASDSPTFRSMVSPMTITNPSG
jgi:hypothetical protein